MRRGFTLLEVLIAALFFLIGILGVIAVFPTAVSAVADDLGQAEATQFKDTLQARMDALGETPTELGLTADGKPHAITRWESASPMDTNREVAVLWIAGDNMNGTLKNPSASRFSYSLTTLGGGFTGYHLWIYAGETRDIAATEARPLEVGEHAYEALYRWNFKIWPRRW